MSQRFSAAKVYKICNTVDDREYVGYTTMSLDRALQYAASDATDSSKRTALLEHMRELGTDKFRIELLEECPCNSADEAKARKEHWVRQLLPALNRLLPRVRPAADAQLPSGELTDSRGHEPRSVLSDRERRMLRRLYTKVFGTHSPRQPERKQRTRTASDPSDDEQTE